MLISAYARGLISCETGFWGHDWNCHQYNVVLDWWSSPSGHGDHYYSFEVWETSSYLDYELSIFQKLGLCCCNTCKPLLLILPRVSSHVVLWNAAQVSPRLLACFIQEMGPWGGSQQQRAKRLHKAPDVRHGAISTSFEGTLGAIWVVVCDHLQCKTLSRHFVHQAVMQHHQKSFSGSSVPTMAEAETALTLLNHSNYACRLHITGHIVFDATSNKKLRTWARVQNNILGKQWAFLKMILALVAQETGHLNAALMSSTKSYTLCR